MEQVYPHVHRMGTTASMHYKCHALMHDIVKDNCIKSSIVEPTFIPIKKMNKYFMMIRPLERLSMSQAMTHKHHSLYFDL